MAFKFTIEFSNGNSILYRIFNEVVPELRKQHKGKIISRRQSGGLKKKNQVDFVEYGLAVVLFFHSSASCC